MKTNIKITFKTNNTITNLLHTTSTTNKHETLGIYKRTCIDFKRAYIGQIGHSLHIRYKEHIKNIKYNKDDAGYTPHILNNIHQYGETEDMEKKNRLSKKGVK
jgi:hypothetical protein